MSIFDFQTMSTLRTVPSPGWARRIGNAVGKLFTPEGSQPTPTGLREDMTTGFVDYNAISTSWTVYRDRKSVYDDLEAMDNGDELVSTALDICANHAVAHLPNSDARMRFLSKNPDTQKILNELDKRLNLREDVWQLARDAYLHGNTFREVVIDRKRMHVSRFRQTVHYQISPKMTDFGDKLPGWIAQNEADFHNGGGRELEEWQIIPIIYGSLLGYYAKPSLASARAGFKRLAMMENGMAVARLTRAYDRLAHHVPVKAGQTKEDILTTIRQYRDNITKRALTVTSDGDLKRIDAAPTVETDFYLPSDGTDRGHIDVLTSTNNQLGNLNDMNYAREKLLSRLKVPTSYLQIMSTQKTHLKSGSGGGGDVEQEFAKELKRLQSVIHKAIRRLADVELMLHGIIPDEDVYQVEFVTIETKDRAADATMMYTYSQAAVSFVEALGVLPPEFIADKFMMLDVLQKEQFTKFFNEYGDKIVKSRVKKLATDAAPPKPTVNTALPGGAQDKAIAASKVTAPRPAAKTKQDEPLLDDVVDAMVQTIEDIHASLVIDAGVGEVPDLPNNLDDIVRQGLLSVTESATFPLQ